MQCFLGGQCGKTSIILRFVQNVFDQKHVPTPVEYTYRKTVTLDNEECKLDILDTSGDDTYSNLRDEVCMVLWLLCVCGCCVFGLGLVSVVLCCVVFRV